jgi:hypothetical protein
MELDLGFKAKPNGRSIGYELATTSAWNRLKSKIYDPVVQVLTNAAAMAIMIIFPPSAAVIVPMLAVADIVNNVDDMVSKHDKGKLTFKSASIDLLQIGLDVLPAARGAKVLNPAKSAVQEAKGAANMRLVLFDAVQLGGQFIVMYERTREQLVEIQDKQISVMAEKYRALVDLEKQVAEHKLNTSDPQLREKRAEIEADAKAIRDTVSMTWTQAVQHQATFFVGSHLVGGHEAAAAGAQANKDTHFEREVPREVTTLRKTAPNQFETEAKNLRVVHAHYEGEGAHTSAIEYDHTNGTAHFDITDKTTGTTTRVEAPVGHVSSFAELHGATNQVVGHPINKNTGLELIEKLNRGDASALHEVGIGDVGDGKLPPDREFGLGELPNGDVVLVTGQRAAVDWAQLPGMTPRAHTHPSSVHEIPLQDDGSRRVPLEELVEPKPDPYFPREVVFPSGADIIVMAHQAVDGHVVVTEFVLRDGMVMKAPVGDDGPRLIFTIVTSHEIGAIPDGRKVYKAKVVGKSAGDTPVNHDVWVVANRSDDNGNLFMTQPAGVILHEAGDNTRAATKTAANRGHHDEPAADHTHDRSMDHSKTDATEPGSRTGSTEGKGTAPVQEIRNDKRVIGEFQNGSYLKIVPRKQRDVLYGGNTIKLEPNRTTTVTGVLQDVNTVAARGEKLEGVTKVGANDGGINILRSPKWQEIQAKHLDVKASDPVRYWELVTTEFWETANKPWLDEAIARDDAFRFVSSPDNERTLYVTDENDQYVLKNGARIRSIFGREVDYLKSKGYEFRPDGTAVKVKSDVHT